MKCEVELMTEVLKHETKLRTEVFLKNLSLGDKFSNVKLSFG